MPDCAALGNLLLTSRRAVASLGFVGRIPRRPGGQRLAGSRPGQCEVAVQWRVRDAVRFPTPVFSSLTVWLPWSPQREAPHA